MITNTIMIVNSLKSSSFQLLESSSDIEHKIKEMDTSTQYIVKGIQQVAGASSEVSEQTNHVSTRIFIGNKDINELLN
ncbi:hypothetical protein [Peribacillus sp. V2I11]|uniref:hypothetical protein n=1 Tax=Peribacillus sp. V2I11 TaxID=3042277 RepID=UPI00278509F6|nr:hypothetical protein [Peribacillus sp. V2I11]MDQ0883864.1 methyl-accepting chemotaxis protein [Peribacillus sp. V2I11]